MSRTSRCLRCGGLIALVPEHYVRPVVSLNSAWVHVSRFGRIKRFKNHAPVINERTNR